MRPHGGCAAPAAWSLAMPSARRGPNVIHTNDLRGALTTPKVNHRAAILEPTAIGALLRAIDGFDGHRMTAIALRLAPLVFVRPGELRHAEWKEFDVDNAEWRIPAEKMKMRRPHRVPLSRQALAILKELKPITGHVAVVVPVGAQCDAAAQRKYAQCRTAPARLRVA